MLKQWYMSRNILKLLGVVCLYFFMLSLSAQPINEIVFSFENSEIKKVFLGSEDVPAAIEPIIYAKNKALALNSSYPYFQFCINHENISSTDKIWRFKNVDERKMDNGGTEYIIHFEVATGTISGLHLAIFQQFFPGSTLVREKLVISAKDGDQFTLNKTNEQNLFNFPSYQVKSKSDGIFKNYEIRIGSWELKPTTFGKRKKGNHMFYPNILESEVVADETIRKGPVNIFTNGDLGWFTAYVHASQDNTNGMFAGSKKIDGQYIVDAMQGTKGVFNFPVTDNDFMFLGIENKKVRQGIEIKIKARRGAYFDGEVINPGNPYSSVWTATAFFPGNKLEDGKQILRDYLLNQICEKQASRKPGYYYNTWGMQRNDRSKPLRELLTYERIFEEIDYAAELGIDLFVLDDGWQQAHGEWFANKERLPQGLAPIKEKLDKHGIKMGLWFSPMGIDSTTQRYQDHPEWVIKDSEGNPILAQWGHPAFDFVSGFYDVFIDDCKQLIDQGCRFMKWDAINTFYSSLPNLHHGDSTVLEEERRARYEYLLPIYVTRAMEELTAYEPELVIEVDLTEARRVMVGLAPLSQGKLFWMNNGASGYNDYSTYRTKSMRTIANEFAGIIPLELFTYANYPHNLDSALKYNTVNSILAGNGFWGNLQLMTKAEREKVGGMVAMAKQIQAFLYGINPELIGEVGDSPEIYKVVNELAGAGKIIGFSSQPTEYVCKTKVIPQNILAVLNSSYQFEKDSLWMKMSFKSPESSILSFIVPNNHVGIRILSSTVPICEVERTDKGLIYQASRKGTQRIQWDGSLGKPIINSDKEFKSKLDKSEGGHGYTIHLENMDKSQRIEIIGK